MGLHKELCLLFMRTHLVSIFLIYECKKLDGYEFPVYSTEFCPRNQTEWNERSSAISCNETNGYMCLPNRRLTQLLEFCYLYPFLWMQEYNCFYLNKQHSRVNNYNCRHFEHGCPTSTYMSSKSFEYQGCVTIGDGCFIAEPSCISTTISRVENTEINYIDDVTINVKYNTTTYFRESTEQSNKGNEPIANNDWILPLTIILGIFIVLLVVCLTGLAIKIRTGPVEGNENEELTPLNERQDETEAMEEGTVKYTAQESQRDQAVFKRWEEENTKFIQTKACKEVEKIIQKENLVIVVGQSGSGKSAIIQHIALKYKNQDWVVKKVNEVKNIIDEFSSSNVLENKTLVVLNDPIGKESFDKISYKYWKDLEYDLEACLKKFKLLVSCRKCVQSDVRARGLFKNKSCIVDIDDCKLTDDEKLKIWNIYKADWISHEIDLREIIKIDAYFPLLCKLFFNNKEHQKNGLHFFKEPVKVYRDDIEYFRSSCKEKYCALVLLVLFNNSLCVDDLLKDDESEEMYKRALILCGMSKDTAPSTIKDTLKTLKGFYVTKVGDIYEFCHDFVMEVTSYVFGKDYPNDMIKYANIGFLRKRVKLEGCNDQNDQLTIYISDRHLDCLGERLLKDIVGKNLVDVVLNPCLKNKKFADALIKNIEKHKEKIERLFVKLNLLLEKQSFDQESQELFFSKLDFVGLNCNISPACALILFSHSDLSSYCLKALQQLPSNLKDSSNFFAVCCNGDEGLFHMFPKEDKETHLKETWGGLYPIHIVSVFHNYEILQELIKLGVDVNQRTKDNDTALHLAVRNITEESIENYINKQMNERGYQTLDLLLFNGANVNLIDQFGFSPLYVACLREQKRTVQLLLSHGADINLRCNCIGSPLTLACSINNCSIVELLLNDNTNVNSCDTQEDFPLLKACQFGQDSIVQHLVDHGAEVNFFDKEVEFSPLYAACLNKHEDTVKLLLNNGADINLCDEFGESLLYKACQGECDSTVQLLLTYNANVNLCNIHGESPLYQACTSGHYYNVKLLLNYGAEVNLCKKIEHSPLYRACQDEDDSIVELLLSYGANINLCNEYGESLLYKACVNVDHNAIVYLLNYGADVNVCTESRDSPLHKACQDGDEVIVELLLDHCSESDINFCNGLGKSPLNIACQNGRDSTVQLLLSKGADINLLDNFGYSPLCVACREGHESIVKLLLNNNADINLNKKYGLSPVFIAFYMRHYAIIKTLLHADADMSIANGLQLHYDSSDWCGKDNITRQYLLRNSNIVDNMYDLDSFFSLFVFCQVEELTRILRQTSKS